MQPRGIQVMMIIKALAVRVKADLCLRGDITYSDDDELSEVSKLTHSELLIYFHEVNGYFERLRENMPNLNHKHFDRIK